MNALEQYAEARKMLSLAEDEKIMITGADEIPTHLPLVKVIGTSRDLARMCCQGEYNVKVVGIEVGGEMHLIHLQREAQKMLIIKN